MAEYIITKKNVVTMDDGRERGGSIVTRKRVDAARLVLEQMAYEAAEGNGALDSRRAWSNLRAARAWNADAPLRLAMGEYRVTADRVA